MSDCNNLPPNLVSLTEKEFVWDHVQIWDVVKTERRHVCRDVDGKALDDFFIPNTKGETALWKKCINNLYMHWVDDHGGWAMQIDKASNKVLYFKFGCHHTNRGPLSPKNMGNYGAMSRQPQMHVSECKDCGEVIVIDSSG